jgi:hypothetical protein
MVTLAAARNAIYDHFFTNFTAIPSARITAENEEFDPPVGQSWVRLAVNHTASVQESLGDVGLRKFSRIGSAFVQIFIPENSGLNSADLLADAVRTVFEGVRLLDNDIRFYNSTVREIGVNEGWYQLSVESEFVYTQTK